MKHLRRLLDWIEHHHRDATVRWTTNQGKPAVTTKPRGK